MNAKKAKELRRLAFIATANNSASGRRLVVDPLHRALTNGKGTMRGAYRKLKSMTQEHGYGEVVSQVAEHYGAKL